MILAHVAGTVVATRKDPRLEGRTLLVLRIESPRGDKRDAFLVAVDTVGAGVGEQVIAVQGSSARLATGCKDTPVDTAIVGIVDAIDLEESDESGD